MFCSLRKACFAARFFAPTRLPQALISLPRVTEQLPGVLLDGEAEDPAQIDPLGARGSDAPDQLRWYRGGAARCPELAARRSGGDCAAMSRGPSLDAPRENCQASFLTIRIIPTFSRVKGEGVS